MLPPRQEPTPDWRGRQKRFLLFKGTTFGFAGMDGVLYQGITMRLTNVLQRVLRLVRSSGDTAPTSSGRAAEQPDESSMADFVRILRDHDSKQPS
jgi:hypothetical protein